MKTKISKEVKNLKLKFIFLILIMDAIAVVLTYFIMPLVQNFPPYSEDFAFQSEVQVLTHVQQYSLVYLIGISIHIFSFSILMKKIYKYVDKLSNNQKMDYAEILEVRKDCINIPYKVFFVQLFLITSIGIIFNFIMLASAFAILRFTLMIVAIASIVSILILMATQKFLSKVCLTTYTITNKYDKNVGFRITNEKNMLFQMTPFITVILIIISLIGYSKAVRQEGFSIGNYYKAYLESKNIQANQVNMDSLKTILADIPIQDDSHYYFVISPDDTIFVSDPNGSISDFVLSYRDYFYERSDGYLYEKFGVDEQLYAMSIQDSSGDTWYIGFKYPVIDMDLLLYYFGIILIVLIIYSILLYFFSRNISDNLIKTTTSLKNIVDSQNPTQNILPILSNDEFGDLAYYYNKIQELTLENIKQIHSNQDLLIEKERLASLGQMVGGIAHNLKTPIMSISGASEGLNQLTDELDASIGNPIVTNEDYHEIVRDMKEWIDKIKTHTSYMSDVITVVKGQTVAFADDQVFTFNVDTLFKQIDILMKHELKSALVTLRVSNNVPDNCNIKGNINSLVQVLNNIISNAIQAYNGKTDEFIDLSANLRDNATIEIVVRDYGPGLPEVVQKNLFKQMITTKGKSGTGLGMFMSYSNIKAHFKGNMSFETEKDKGTAFIITIPIENNEV